MPASYSKKRVRDRALHAHWDKLPDAHFAKVGISRDAIKQAQLALQGQRADSCGRVDRAALDRERLRRYRHPVIAELVLERLRELHLQAAGPHRVAGAKSRRRKREQSHQRERDDRK